MKTSTHIMRWILMAALLTACEEQQNEEDTSCDCTTCDCGAIWQPVCADGVTYDNECVAICAGAKDIKDGEC